MSSRLAKYKRAGTGSTVQSKKASIREEKSKEAKRKRNDKFMGRRVLTEVSQSETTSKEKAKKPRPRDVVRPTRSTAARMEEFTKWKEERDAQKAKDKEKTKQRPPFVVGKFVLGTDTLKENPVKSKKPAKAKAKKERRPAGKKGISKLSSPKATPTEVDNNVQAQHLPDECRAVPAVPTPVNHTAWIPDATLPSQKITQTFEELFPTDSFSPFKFTGNDGCKGKITFRSQMKSPPKEAAIEVTEDEEMDTSYCAAVEKKASRSDDSVEMINHSILHNHEMANTINELEALPEPTPVPNQPCDLAFFRQLYDDIIAKFTVLCEQWEAKEAELQAASEANEEVYDQIRTTVCQARLLMRSKLKQYIGLVEKAEDPSQPLPTTAEDLQGFWDMMYLQISSIETKFKHLEKMGGNDWQDVSLSPLDGKKGKGKAAKLHKKRRASRGSKVKTPSDKLKADRAKREEQRRLLREKMKAAKDKKTRKSNSPPTAVSPPTSGSGLTPPPSKGAAVDSSMVDDRLVSTSDLVPTADLVSFTPPKKTPLKLSKRKSMSLLKSVLISSSSSSDENSGSVTKLVKINASKRLKEELGSDVIMSPARRSVRIHRKSVNVVEDPIEFVQELPDDTGCVVYKPNASIADFNLA